MQLYQLPLPVITLLFLTLVALGHCYGTAMIYYLTLSLAGLIALLYQFHQLKRYQSWSLRIMLAALLSTSAFALDSRNNRAISPLITDIGDERVEADIEAIILSAPTRSNFGWLLEIQILKRDRLVYSTGRLSPNSGPTVYLFYPNELANHYIPLPGDKISGFIRLQNFFPAMMPHDIDMRDYMHGRGIAASASTNEKLIKLGQQQSWRIKLLRFLATQKLQFEDHLLRLLPLPNASLALAMLTGTKNLIKPQFRYLFDTTGTSHILAISGLHLSIIGAGLWWFFGQLTNLSPTLLRRYSRRRICCLAVWGVLSLYVLFIGAPTSACRALLMLSIVIITLLLMRTFCSIHALCTAALCLVFYRPGILLEIGFQLSFAATAGILFFLRNATHWPSRITHAHVLTPTTIQKKIRHTLTFIGVSLSASLATWPVIWPITGEIPLAGLWLNLIIVPLISAIVFPMLLLGALLSYLWPTLDLPLLYWGTEIIILIARALELVLSWPASTWRWGVPRPLEWIAVTAAITVLIVAAYQLRSVIVAAAFACIAAIPTIYHTILPPAETLKIHAIAVGQGDATLIEFPNKQTLLIDAGGTPRGRDPGLTVVLPYLKRLGIRHLDALLITHSHHDHIAGAHALVNPFQPATFFYDPHDYTPSLQKLQEKLARVKTKQIAVNRHLKWSIGGQTLDFLRPPQTVDKNINNTSLITYFRYHHTTVLLPGDIEAQAEQWLLDFGINHATILKVPHHGSNTSSTNAFVKKMQPQIALISAGKFNRFGHPHTDIITRYTQQNTAIYRTDQHGLIRLHITPQGQITSYIKHSQ